MDVQKANRIRDLLDQRDGIDDELSHLMQGGELNAEPSQAPNKRKGRPAGSKNKPKEEASKEEGHQLALMSPASAEAN